MVDDFGRDPLEEEKFFLYGQGKSSLGEYDESGGHCCRCWLVPFRLRTWSNFFYNVVVNAYFACLCFAVCTAFMVLTVCTLPLCVGIPIGVLSLYLIRRLATLDLRVAQCFARPNNVHRSDPPEDESGLKDWAYAIVSDVQTWKDLLYCWILKFPFGLAAFLVAGIAVGVSLAFISAPIVYFSCDPCMKDGNLCFGPTSYNDTAGETAWEDGTCDGWKIDSPEDSFALMFIGLPLLVVACHLSNLFAWMNQALARCMLSDRNSDEEALLYPHDNMRKGKRRNESDAVKAARRNQIERKYNVAQSQGPAYADYGGEV